MNSITYNQILNTAFLTVLRCLCFYLVYVPRIICIAANSLNNNLSKAELPTSEGAEMISVSSQGTPNIQKISLITLLLLKFILLAASSKKIVIRSPENGKEKNIQGHRRAKIGDFDSLIGHSTGTASPENIPIPGGIRAKVSLRVQEEVLNTAQFSCSKVRRLNLLGCQYYSLPRLKRNR